MLRVVDPTVRVGLLVMTVLVGVACGPAPTPPPTVAPAPIALFATADTEGFIVPCGCASRQLGGMPRRGTALAERRRAGPVLAVDAGGSVARTSDFDRLTLQFVWQGMVELGYSAANLGGGEAGFGAEQLGSLATETRVPLLSTNIRPTGDSAWLPPHRIVEVGGARIGILGVAGAGTPVGAGLAISPPAGALGPAVAALRPQVGVLVLLAHVDSDELLALARQFPEVDVVLGGPTGQPIAPHREGAVLVGSSTPRGKFVALGRFEPAGSAWRAEPGAPPILELADTIPDDAGQVALLGRFQAALRADPIPPERSGLTARLLDGLPRSYAYAGSAACQGCHAAEHATWAASAHAHGLETLTRKGFDASPYCLRCHTTGYGGPGGFRTAAESAARGGIGCESCHGPSQAHVQDPRGARTPVPGHRACVTCHDPENSPAFDYAAYWSRIRHGKEAR